MSERDDIAKVFHNFYLMTAKAFHWPIRPEVDVEFEGLSRDAQELDYALADFHLAEIARLRAERDEALAQASGALIRHLREDDHGYGCRLCGCTLSDPSIAAARALLDRLEELATRNVSLGQDILVYETESAQLKRRLQRAEAVVQAAMMVPTCDTGWRGDDHEPCHQQLDVWMTELLQRARAAYRERA